MKLSSNRGQAIAGILVFCFLMVIMISACGESSQKCSGIVNVNSCTSSQTDTQTTIEATTQSGLNATALAQATTQSSLNATASAQATTQTNLDVTANEQATAQANIEATTTVLTGQKNKDANIVSTAGIIIPVSLLISIIALITGIYMWKSFVPREYSQTKNLASVTLGAVITAIVLLLLMTVIVFFR